MSENVVYRPRITVTRHRDLDRSAEMPAGEQIRFGAHGDVAKHYGRDPEAVEPVSTTLDYVVAAACG